MRTNYFVATIAAIASNANAFWGTGHLIISRQAEAILTEEAPEALSAALEVLVPLAKYYPTLTDGEKDHPFTECANFADDIKGKGYSW